MFWLVFLFLAFALYISPPNLAGYLLQQADRAELIAPVVRWPLPGWLVLTVGVIGGYICLGWISFLITRQFFPDHLPGQAARRISAVSFKSAGVWLFWLAVLILLLKVVLLPGINLLYGTSYHLSAEVAVLALLTLVAEMYQLVERTAWEDFENRRHWAREFRRRGYEH